MDTVGMELAMVSTVPLFYDLGLRDVKAAVDLSNGITRRQEDKVSQSLRLCKIGIIISIILPQLCTSESKLSKGKV